MAFSLFPYKHTHFIHCSITSALHCCDSMNMDDELYTFTSSISYPNSITNTAHQYHQPQDGTTGFEMSDIIKAQIANHPLYPTLLNAYIDCTKVGAPPEMASLLDEISKQNYHNIISDVTTHIGMDPELDDFMKSYCEALHKYKEEISKPFDEATNFLSTIQSQLTDLCTKQTLQSSHQSPDDDGGCGWEDDMMMTSSCGEYSGGAPRRQGEEEVKQMLMRKYSGYLSSLRKEFLKKRKKGKLPNDAISALLDWWNTHYRWPYPTEGEKNRLSEMTGLDHKQINNWFINQRKRHWRPSDDMRSALMEGMADAAGSFYFDPTAGIGT